MKMFILMIFQNMKAIIDVFSSMHDESWLWHRRLGHVNMNLITQLNKNELVRGLLRPYSCAEFYSQA